MAEWVPPQVGGRAVRLSVARTTVTVRSPLPAVVERVARYVSPWWDVAPGQGTTGPVVTARLGGFEDLEREVAGGAWREVPYPRAATRYARLRSGTSVVAVTPTERVAFRYTPATGRMEVHGHEPEALVRASVRVARELVRAQLIAAGWVVLHASAVVVADGRALLVLGGRGAGKSTAAFTLASRGARLLGNDRVFARARDDGAVELAPWPSGAAVGLGLLGALGWTRVVRTRLLGGAEPHPSQDAKVTAAIAAGCTGRLGADGRELKAHLRPHEFAEWFERRLRVLGPGGGGVLPGRPRRRCAWDRCGTPRRGVGAGFHDARPGGLLPRHFRADRRPGRRHRARPGGRGRRAGPPAHARRAAGIRAGR